MSQGIHDTRGIWALVYQWLPPVDIIRVSRTCRDMYWETYDTVLWDAIAAKIILPDTVLAQIPEDLRACSRAKWIAWAVAARAQSRSKLAAALAAVHRNKPGAALDNTARLLDLSFQVVAACIGKDTRGRPSVRLAHAPAGLPRFARRASTAAQTAGTSQSSTARRWAASQVGARASTGTRDWWGGHVVEGPVFLPADTATRRLPHVFLVLASSATLKCTVPVAVLRTALLGRQPSVAQGEPGSDLVVRAVQLCAPSAALLAACQQHWQYVLPLSHATHGKLLTDVLAAGNFADPSSGVGMAWIGEMQASVAFLTLSISLPQVLQRILAIRLRGVSAHTARAGSQAGAKYWAAAAQGLQRFQSGVWSRARPSKPPADALSPTSALVGKAAPSSFRAMRRAARAEVQGSSRRPSQPTRSTAPVPTKPQASQLPQLRPAIRGSAATAVSRTPASAARRKAALSRSSSTAAGTMPASAQAPAPAWVYAPISEHPPPSHGGWTIRLLLRGLCGIGRQRQAAAPAGSFALATAESESMAAHDIPWLGPAIWAELEEQYGEWRVEPDGAVSLELVPGLGVMGASSLELASRQLHHSGPLAVRWALSAGQARVPANLQAMTSLPEVQLYNASARAAAAEAAARRARNGPQRATGGMDSSNFALLHGLLPRAAVVELALWDEAGYCWGCQAALVQAECDTLPATFRTQLCGVQVDVACATMHSDTGEPHVGLAHVMLSADKRWPALAKPTTR